MPLVIGQTPGGVLVPIQVDANGVVSVSAAVSSLPTLPAGDNNIGNVDIVSLPSLPAGNNNIGNVDIVTLPATPAGTNMIGKIQAWSYGHEGGSFNKDPIRFGFSGQILLDWANEDLSTGLNSIDSPAVDPGEIWVITNLTMRYAGTVPTRMDIGVYDGSDTYYAFRQVSPASATLYDRQGFWVLVEGDKIRLVVNGATEDDKAFAKAIGYRVDIDQ